jgi:hypothetical protein
MFVVTPHLTLRLKSIYNSVGEHVFVFRVSITPSLSTVHSFWKDKNRGDISDIHNLSSDSCA